VFVSQTHKQRAALASGLLLTALMGAGCQLWQVEPSVWQAVETQAQFETVHAALNEEGWHLNRNWSPRHEWEHRHAGRPDPAHLRWTFAPALKSTSSSAESSPEKPSGPLAKLVKESRGEPADSSATGPKNDKKENAPSESQSNNTANDGSKDDHSGKDGSSKTTAAKSDAAAPGGNESKPETAPAAQQSADASDNTQNAAASSETGAAESGEKARTPSTDAPWDGFWPLSIDRLIAKTTAEETGIPAAGDDEELRTLQRSLAVLARSDDLAGWNAAILWARYNPSEAAEAIPVLERLVTQPPHYDSKTGRRAFPGAAAPAPADKGSADASAAAKPQPQSGAAKVSRDAIATWQQWTGVDDAEQQGAVAGGKARLISTSMRLAAAEAWCLALAYSEADPVDGLAPAGRFLEQTDLPNDVRGELFRGAARWVAPASIPRLENALREGEKHERAPVEIRRAAMEACLVHAFWNAEASNAPSSDAAASAGRSAFDASEWPATCIACRYDPDPQVRWNFGRWMGVVGHPESLDILKAQLHDVDIRVREEALTSLAELGTEAARDELRAQVARSRDKVRAAAVRSLASWGIAEITPFARDESYLVRGTVAELLGREPCVEAAVLLQELMIDSNPSVQSAALAAGAQWPDTLAIPLLLQGMRDSSAETRKDCFQQLMKRRSVRTLYRFDASPEERARAVAQLILEENLPANYLDRISQAGLRTAAKVDELHAAEVHGLLADLNANSPGTPSYEATLERLLNLTPADLPILEEHLLSTSASSSSVLVRSVLPRLSPVYAAIVELQSADVPVRRHGAGTLSQIGQGTSLSPLALRLLREHLAQEQDRWVWRASLAAVAADSTEESGQIALLAVNHAWPDIRELGCEHVGRHGQPREALWLLPLLDDPNKSVQLAAIRAMGNCHNPIVLDGLAESSGGTRRRGLREYLSHPDKTLQFAAVSSMSRLGDAQGMQELVRMSYHQSAQSREEAVRQMGLTGQSQFVGHLINLAWTESHDSVRRAILESLDRLVSADKRPAGLSQAASYDDKIRLWAAWWQA